jgi:hypothetical protein
VPQLYQVQRFILQEKISTGWVFKIVDKNNNVFNLLNAHCRRLNRLAADVAEEKPSLPEKYGPFYLDQPIDHFSLNETTFKHRYWANTDWYQPGGPVICKQQSYSS